MSIGGHFDACCICANGGNCGYKPEPIAVAPTPIYKVEPSYIPPCPPPSEATGRHHFVTMLCVGEENHTVSQCCLCAVVVHYTLHLGKDSGPTYYKLGMWQSTDPGCQAIAADQA